MQVWQEVTETGDRCMSLLRRIEKGGGSGSGGDNPPRDPGEQGTPDAGDESRLAAMRSRNQLNHLALCAADISTCA